jgi:hypothetical protein
MVFDCFLQLIDPMSTVETNQGLSEVALKEEWEFMVCLNDWPCGKKYLQTLMKLRDECFTQAKKETDLEEAEDYKENIQLYMKAIISVENLRDDPSNSEDLIFLKAYADKIENVLGLLNLNIVINSIEKAPK